MSNETATPPEEAPPSWFPLPKFTPTAEIRLHAAELRLALMEKEAKHAACKRTPRGYLKKGQDVPYQDAQKACDAVFRKHAALVRDSMLEENQAYIRQAKREVFNQLIKDTPRFNDAISALPFESSWNTNGDPIIFIKSSLGNDFTFRFTIDAALISRVEVYGDQRWNIATITHDRWSRGQTYTRMGSVSMSSGEPEFFIEFAWVIDLASRLCQDVAEHNKKYEGDQWQSFNRYTTIAEKEAYGITWDDCVVPEPIEKEEAETNTPTA